MNLTRRHHGAAGIIFIGLLPILFSLLTVSINIANKLSTHTRMLEAAEVSGIAVAAESTLDSSNRANYVTSLVDRYMTNNLGAVTAEVTEKSCKTGDTCDGALVTTPFTELKVTASSNHKSLFDNSEYGASQDFSVSGSAKVRKYQSSGPVDVYFVVDQSRVMVEDYFSEGGGRKRIQVADEAIVNTINAIKAFDTSGQSRVGFLGFTEHVAESVGGRATCRPLTYGGSWIYYDKRRLLDYRRGNVPWRMVWNLFDPPEIPRQTQDCNDWPPGTVNEEVRHWNIRINVLYKVRNRTLTSNLDSVANTINNQKITRGEWLQLINGMAGAAQMANSMPKLNSRQLFVIITDGGVSTSNPDGFKQAVQLGFCDKIREQLATKSSFQAGSISTDFLYIQMRNMGTYPNYYGVDDCVGDNNIVTAFTANKIEEAIMSKINTGEGNFLHN